MVEKKKNILEISDEKEKIEINIFVNLSSYIYFS